MERIGGVEHSPIATVLVVDDEEAVRAVILRLVERMGFEVLGASDGHEALDRIRAQPVDFVLSDVDMPRMSGPELYNALSSEHPVLARSFAFFTGAPPLDLPDGVQVLTKPVDKERLREVLGGGRVRLTRCCPDPTRPEIR